MSTGRPFWVWKAAAEVVSAASVTGRINLMAEPTFKELTDLMRNSATQVENAMTLEQLKDALAPALRALSDRYEGRDRDHS